MTILLALAAGTWIAYAVITRDRRARSLDAGRLFVLFSGVVAGMAVASAFVFCAYALGGGTHDGTIDHVALLFAIIFLIGLAVPCVLEIVAVVLMRRRIGAERARAALIGPSIWFVCLAICVAHGLVLPLE